MDNLYKIFTGFLQMSWDIYWGLAFGFILSSLVRAFVSTESISTRLGKNSVAAIALSTFFGAVSSSCSYAAASMSRTLLVKGATWSNAVVFMVASTNLVFEIFIVIVTLLGWSFFAGEVLGGLFFIVISASLIAWFYPSKTKKEAMQKIADSEKTGSSNDSHAQHHSMDHSMHQNHAQHPDHSMQPASEKRLKPKLKAAAGYFYMDVTMVGKDILIGVAIASILMVLVPASIWKSLFLSDNSNLPHIVVLMWNDLVGILIAIFAFVCSVGNIVMAVVLWKGGISFGGVIAFILADLVTVPMLMVYKSYYGFRTMWALLLVLSISIFFTALLVDFSFASLHWIPEHHGTGMQQMEHFQWNWQAWLNVFFIPLSLVYFFVGKRSMK